MWARAFGERGFACVCLATTGLTLPWRFACLRCNRKSALQRMFLEVELMERCGVVPGKISTEPALAGMVMMSSPCTSFSLPMSSRATASSDT